MRHLASVRASRVRFTEEKTIAALTKPLESEGWLEYRRPDHLEKTTTAPRQESLMVDGDRLSIVEAGEQPQLIDLASEPALAGLVEAVRGTLSGDLESLRRSYAVSIQGNPDQSWRLTLTPSDRELAAILRQVVIEGTGAALSRVRTVQANGDVSLLTVAPAG